MSQTAKKISVAFVMVLALMLGLTSVYSATTYDAEGTTRISSADILQIRVHEMAFDPTDSNEDGIADVASNLEESGSSVAISPCVQNTSNVDGWVYLEVDTPTSILGGSAYTYDVLDGWTYLDQYIEDGRVKTVYAYDEIINAGSETTLLFDDLYYKTKVANPDSAYVKFTGYAIQSAHVDDPAMGWELYKKKHN